MKGTNLSDEFEQLLLVSSEGCGLRINRFIVHSVFICTCALPLDMHSAVSEHVLLMAHAFFIQH
jgi:hypothetical protein